MQNEFSYFIKPAIHTPPSVSSDWMLIAVYFISSTEALYFISSTEGLAAGQNRPNGPGILLRGLRKKAGISYNKITINGIVLNQ